MSGTGNQSEPLEGFENARDSRPRDDHPLCDHGRRNRLAGPSQDSECIEARVRRDPEPIQEPVQFRQHRHRERGRGSRSTRSPAPRPRETPFRIGQEPGQAVPRVASAFWLTSIPRVVRLRTTFRGRANDATSSYSAREASRHLRATFRRVAREPPLVPEILEFIQDDRAVSRRSAHFHVVERTDPGWLPRLSIRCAHPRVHRTFCSACWTMWALEPRPPSAARATPPRPSLPKSAGGSPWPASRHSGRSNAAEGPLVTGGEQTDRPGSGRAQ